MVSPTGYLLLVLVAPLLLACQWHCCSALASSYGPTAARTSMHYALAVCSHMLAVFARRVLRVSAAARRGAAAYADDTWHFFEARTHHCLLGRAIHKSLR